MSIVISIHILSIEVSGYCNQSCKTAKPFYQSLLDLIHSKCFGNILGYLISGSYYLVRV